VLNVLRAATPTDFAASPQLEWRCILREGVA
jgi:hypothetical protein